MADQAVADKDGVSKAGRYYTEYLDIESFALKYVLEEFLAFNDAGRSSAYYYKDANDILRAGPGWDFEGIFRGNAQSLTMLNGTSYSTALYEQLMQHDDFKRLVIELYNTRLYPAIHKLQQSKLIELRDIIAKSAEMDSIRWGREDFFDSCEDILSWIDERVQFLEQQCNSNEEWVVLKFMSNWSNNHYLYIRPGETVTQEMVTQFQIPQVLTWRDSCGDQLVFDQPIYEDTIFYGESEAVHRDITSLLLEYAKQVTPELLFAVVFLGVSVLFIFQTNRGRWKK